MSESPISRFVRILLAASIAASIWLAPPAQADQNAVQVPTGSPLPGLTLVNDVNAAFKSFATVFSGGSAPSVSLCNQNAGCTTAGYLWHDTGTNTVKIRDQADSAWITLFGIDEANKIGAAAAAVLSTGAGQTISGANHYPNIVLTASASLSLSRANTLWNGFAVNVYAQGGNVTLAPNAADKFNGGTAGANLVVPEGYAASLVTDAASAGTWSVALERMTLGNCSVVSASTIDLGAVGCPALTITGSTGPITGFGATAQAGQVFFVTLASTPQLAYNATSMILNTGGVNYTASAGDRLIAKALGSGNFEVTIMPASGQPPVLSFAPPRALISGLTGEATISTSINYDIGEVTTKTTLGNNTYLASDVAVQFGCLVTGAGGIDVGSCPTSGALNVYLITNGTGVWSTLGWSGQSTATVGATIGGAGSVVTGITGLSGGLGYSRPPRIYTSAMSGCTTVPTFHATVSGGAVASVSVDNNGSSGCSAVTITIDPPDNEIYYGSHMPAGYTAMALLGSYPMQNFFGSAAFNFPVGGPNSAVTLPYFWQIGRTVYFGPNNALSISSAVPTAYTTSPVSIAALVPSNVRSIGGNLGSPASTGVIAEIAGDPNGITAQHCGANDSTVLDSMYAGCPFANLPILAFPSGNPTFYYKSGSSTIGVRVDLTSYSLGEQEP